MSLARGIKHGRKSIILEHRNAKFEEAFDRYCRGEVSAEYVGERRNKVKAIRGSRVPKR